MANIEGSPGPRTRTPTGACDTHIHVYDSKYPLAPTATGKPADASAEDYRAVMHRLGLARAVVVQPSAYGTDNRCTLAAIPRLAWTRRAGLPWSTTR